MNGRLAASTGLASVLILAACDTSQVQGRYYQRGRWLEFHSGIVVHGELGEAVSYRLDGAKIVLSSRTLSVEGQIVSPTTLRFGGGTGAMAEAFAGVWTLADMSGRDVRKGPDAQKAAEVIVGRWRIPDETDVFDVRKDGTYTWGSRISGAYQMLQGQRVRMTLVQNGRLAGHLDYDFVVEDGMLKLTLPDGSVTEYERAE